MNHYVLFDREDEMKLCKDFYNCVREFTILCITLTGMVSFDATKIERIIFRFDFLIVIKGVLVTKSIQKNLPQYTSTSIYLTSK